MGKVKSMYCTCSLNRLKWITDCENPFLKEKGEEGCSVFGIFLRTNLKHIQRN